MFRTVAIAMACLTVLAACGREEPPAEPAPVAWDTPLDFLDAQNGKLVVLLVGMEGCAKTMSGTKLLAELTPDLPDGVVVARVDAPPPGGSIEEVENWPHAYYYDVDLDRDVADRLDFFYYPTLYLIDAEGEVRFSGGCDDRKAIESMVAAITAEKPGDEKHVYTPPLVPVGDAAPAVAAKGLDGKQVAFENFEAEGPTLLFFNSIGCPFSAKAVAGLPDLEAEFEEHGVAYVIVEKSKATAKVRKFYDETDVPGTVLHDADGEVSRLYGVEPAPFFYVLDDTGTVAARGPYTEGAAMKALADVLGIEGGCGGGSSSGAG
jgi:peroxiredoxin